MARTRAATENWYTCTATSRKPNASLERPRKAPLLMIFRIRAVSDLLEPCEAKVSNTVLRGGGGGDTLALPGVGIDPHGDLARRKQEMAALPDRCCSPECGRG